MTIDVQEKFINGMPESEFKAYESRYRDQSLARKGYQVGGTNGAGGNFGSSWLNDSGFWDGQGANKFKVKAAELIDNSAVMACIFWLMDTFPEAPLVVAKRQPNKTMGDILIDHAMDRLIAEPNGYYSGLLMWQATIMSFNLDGNAFWLKVRNGGGHGKPVELWYEPHFSIRVKPGTGRPGDPPIQGYEIWRNGEWIHVDTQDVVHFRYGLDPTRPGMGISRTRAILREVFTDNEAQMYTATILHNMGVVGWVVTPKSGGTILNPTGLRQLIESKFTGAGRGTPMVWDEELNVVKPDNDPNKTGSNPEPRRIPEERICSNMRVNRMVAGLGSDPKFANMKEAREAGYEENIIPTHRLFGTTIDIQLLRDFTDDRTLGTFFSYAGVRVLQDDMNALYTRTSSALSSGMFPLAWAQRAVGEESLPGTEDVWYIPNGVKVVKSPIEAIAQPVDPTPIPPNEPVAPPAPLEDADPTKAPRGPLDTKAKKDTEESITADIEKATASAIERAYKKAESAVGK